MTLGFSSGDFQLVTWNLVHLTYAKGITLNCRKEVVLGLWVLVFTYLRLYKLEIAISQVARHLCKLLHLIQGISSYFIQKYTRITENRG